MKYRDGLLAFPTKSKTGNIKVTEIDRVLISLPYQAGLSK
jgi:hypothetical protein